VNFICFLQFAKQFSAGSQLPGRPNLIFFLEVFPFFEETAPSAIHQSISTPVLFFNQLIGFL
jgi:hypothetical protein